jgi:hypothetical protein
MHRIKFRMKALSIEADGRGDKAKEALALADGFSRASTLSVHPWTDDFANPSQSRIQRISTGYDLPGISMTAGSNAEK